MRRALRSTLPRKWGGAVPPATAALRKGVAHYAADTDTVRVVRAPVVQFKKCRFQGGSVKISDAGDVQAALAAVTAERKVARATHPAMYAWRVAGDSGHGDDGERGAGRVLLQMLNDRDADGVLVAVTRWYGGAHLGSARFRAIRTAARSALDALDAE